MHATLARTHTDQKYMYVVYGYFNGIIKIRNIKTHLITDVDEMLINFNFLFIWKRGNSADSYHFHIQFIPYIGLISGIEKAVQGTDNSTYYLYV